MELEWERNALLGLHVADPWSWRGSRLCHVESHPAASLILPAGIAWLTSSEPRWHPLSTLKMTDRIPWQPVGPSARPSSDPVVVRTVSLDTHSVTGWIKLIVTSLLNVRSYFLLPCYYGGSGCHEGPTCHLLVGPGGWSQSPMCITRRFYCCLKKFFLNPRSSCSTSSWN